MFSAEVRDVHSKSGILDVDGVACVFIGNDFDAGMPAGIPWVYLLR